MNQFIRVHAHTPGRPEIVLNTQHIVGFADHEICLAQQFYLRVLGGFANSEGGSRFNCIETKEEILNLIYEGR